MDNKKIKITLYEEKYEEQLIEFIRKVWVRDITKDLFHSKQTNDMKNNPYSQGKRFPIAIALCENTIVGHIALKPCGLLLNGQEVTGFWQAGIHVNEKFRGMGIATQLSQLIINRDEVVTGFFVVDQTLKLKKTLGWDLPGKVPDFMKIIRPKEFIKEVNLSNLPVVPDRIKYIFNVFQKFWKIPVIYLFTAAMHTYNLKSKLFKTKTKIDNINIVETFDKRIDTLWETNKSFLSNAQVRKSDYLNWSFNKSKGWIKVIYEKDNKVLGYIILSLKTFETGSRLSGINTCSLIDIFWDLTQPNIFASLLAFSEKYARSQGAVILFCTINYKPINKFLSKASFFEIPRSVYFSIYTSNKDIEYSKELSDWFITRGDADAAGSLGQEIRG